MLKDHLSGEEAVFLQRKDHIQYDVYTLIRHKSASYEIRPRCGKASVAVNTVRGIMSICGFKY